MQRVYIATGAAAFASADYDDDDDDDNNDDDDISKINETLINYSEQCDQGVAERQQAKKAG